MSSQLQVVGATAWIPERYPWQTAVWSPVMACMHVAIDPGIVMFTRAHPLQDINVAQASPPSADAPASTGVVAPLSAGGKHDAVQLDIEHSYTVGPQETQLLVVHAVRADEHRL